MWLTSTVRPAANPADCKAGSSHPSAKAFPVENAGRHLAVYDPSTKKLTHIATCFGTHHLMFAEDANHTLWTSGGGQVIGWLNTKMFDETQDEMKSQGWTALIRDANGNGKRDASSSQVSRSTRPRISASAARSMRSRLRRTARSGACSSAIPGAIIRLSPGANPPETAITESTCRRPTRAIRRAAATWTATASIGRRWRAATWPASTAASAKAR